MAEDQASQVVEPVKFWSPEREDGLRELFTVIGMAALSSDAGRIDQILESEMGKLSVLEKDLSANEKAVLVYVTALRRSIALLVREALGDLSQDFEPDEIAGQLNFEEEELRMGLHPETRRLSFNIKAAKEIRRVFHKWLTEAGATEKVARSITDRFDRQFLEEVHLIEQDKGPEQHQTLRGANLMGANLEGANLDGVDLQGANLQSANLKNAKLSESNLSSAVLFDTSLDGANLDDANLACVLSFSELKGATLVGANLDGACLQSAIFSRVNLASASMREVNYKGTSFRNTRGTPRNASPEFLARIQAGREDS